MACRCVVDHCVLPQSSIAIQPEVTNWLGQWDVFYKRKILFLAGRVFFGFFSLVTLSWMSFLPSLFFIVELWTLTLTEPIETCSSFDLDVVMGSFMTSWMSCRYLLGVIFGGQLYNTLLCHLHLRKTLSPQSAFRNGFVDLSRQLDVIKITSSSVLWILVFCCSFPRSFVRLHFFS